MQIQHADMRLTVIWKRVYGVNYTGENRAYWLLSQEKSQKYHLFPQLNHF
jgi:hypothetical protein